MPCSWRSGQELAESLVADGHLVAIDVLERTQESFDSAFEHARAGEGELRD
jgi:endonuclease YncB( thermonuclease family)